jgi:hypothetical protein
LDTIKPKASIGSPPTFLSTKILEVKVSKKVKVKTEIYSRCCGYFRPVMQWNSAKQAEFSDRVVFKVPINAHNEVLAV